MPLSPVPISNRPIRFALVGCGRIAGKHFEALARQTPGVVGALPFQIVGGVREGAGMRLALRLLLAAMLVRRSLRAFPGMALS